MKKARDIQVNPIAVIVGFILVGLVVAYVGFIRPAQKEADIAKNWNTEAEASKRGPGRKFSQAYDQKLQELLAKQGRAQGQTGGRRQRE